METFDTGKAIWEARFDIQGCADSIEYYGGIAAGITGISSIAKNKQNQIFLKKKRW